MKKVVFYSLATLLIIIWLIPFIAVFFTSFKTMDTLMSTHNWLFPSKIWHFENFTTAWEDGNMKQYFLNTFIITIPSVLGALFISSLSAFALSWYEFKLSKPII